MKPPHAESRSAVTEIYELGADPVRDEAGRAMRGRERLSRSGVRWLTFGLLSVVVIVATVVALAMSTLLNASAAERSPVRVSTGNLALAQTKHQATLKLMSDTSKLPTSAREVSLPAATISDINTALADKAIIGTANTAATRGIESGAQVLSVPDWTNMVVSYPEHAPAALRPPAEEFPVFPGAAPTTGNEDTRDDTLSNLAMIATMSASTHKGYIATGSIDEVVLFYEQALPRHGWTPAGVRVLPSSKGNGTRKELSYTWSDATEASPFSTTFRLAVDEMWVGTVSIDVSVQREPSLKQMPLYPGAANAQNKEQVRSEARNSTSYFTRSYRVVSYVVHASPQEIQGFYMAFLSRYLYAGVQHSASEIWFMYDYPANPQFGLQLSTRAEKGGMTTVELSMPLARDASAQR